MINWYKYKSSCIDMKEEKRRGVYMQIKKGEYDMEGLFEGNEVYVDRD